MAFTEKLKTSKGFGACKLIVDGRSVSVNRTPSQAARRPYNR
jgi:hypothetical protein